MVCVAKRENARNVAPVRWQTGYNVLRKYYCIIYCKLALRTQIKRTAVATPQTLTLGTGAETAVNSDIYSDSPPVRSVTCGFY